MICSYYGEESNKRIVILFEIYGDSQLIEGEFIGIDAILLSNQVSLRDGVGQIESQRNMWFAIFKDLFNFSCQELDIIYIYPTILWYKVAVQMRENTWIV